MGKITSHIYIYTHIHIYIYIIYEMENKSHVPNHQAAFPGHYLDNHGVTSAGEWLGWRMVS